MLSLKELKRHIRNIKVFRAYSFGEFVKQAFLFPFDYFCKSGRSSYPLNVAFFITLRCNARCSICKLKDILNEKGEKEPALEDIKKFLTDIKGVKPSIILYGGEPFVRKDIVDIVALIKKRKFQCGIFTNGILLNESIISDLVSLKTDFIAFSIHGMKDKHDKAVGIKGAFDKLFENMELLIRRKRHTKIIAQIMITEDNLEDLAVLADLAMDKGVDLIRFGHLTFFTASDGSRNRKACESLFPEESISEMSHIYDPRDKAEKYYNAIKDLKKRFGLNVTFLPDLSLPEVKNWYSKDFKTGRKCLFLWRGLFIYPNGDVYPCESLKYPVGNIYRENLSEIWNNERYLMLRKVLRKGLLPACARCCKL